jgi:hypothetical protein
MPEREGAAPPDYGHTLHTVWNESLTALERRDEAAADLLRLCAYIAPDDLPRSVLVAAAGELPDPLRNRTSSPEALADLVALPRSYSLLNASPDAVGMHRLLQTFVRGQLNTEGQRVTL